MSVARQLCLVLAFNIPTLSGEISTLLEGCELAYNSSSVTGCHRKVANLKTVWAKTRPSQNKRMSNLLQSLAFNWKAEITHTIILYKIVLKLLVNLQ